MVISLSVREMVHVLTDKGGCRVQGKRNISKQLKMRMFSECDDLVLQELGTEQVP